MKTIEEPEIDLSFANGPKRTECYEYVARMGTCLYIRVKIGFALPQRRELYITTIEGSGILAGGNYAIKNYSRTPEDYYEEYQRLKKGFPYVPISDKEFDSVLACVYNGIKKID